MKKILLLAIIAIMAIPAAEARRRETPEEIERKTRHYEGFEYGAAARFSLVFYEHEYMRVASQPSVNAYQSQAKFGGNVMLHGGYFINNHWKVGAEIGAQIQYDYTVVPIYATAHYYYGKRKNCLFNFVNLGTNMLFDKGARFGGIAAGGVGFRFQGPDKNNKIDIMVGYQALLMTPRPVTYPPYMYGKKDLKRNRLDQSVFIGVGIAF